MGMLQHQPRKDDGHGFELDAGHRLLRNFDRGHFGTRHAKENKINGKIIAYDVYLKLEDTKKLFCEFYEWVGSSSEGNLQWHRNRNKRFERNYVAGKKHGDFLIYKQNGEEEFFGTFEIKINY
jgi:hypothetical protein